MLFFSTDEESMVKVETLIRNTVLCLEINIRSYHDNVITQLIFVCKRVPLFQLKTGLGGWLTAVFYKQICDQNVCYVQQDSNWENRLRCTEAILGNKMSKKSTSFVEFLCNTCFSYLPPDLFHFSRSYLVRLVPTLLASHKNLLIRDGLTIRLPLSLVLSVFYFNKHGINRGRGLSSYSGLHTYAARAHLLNTALSMSNNNIITVHVQFILKCMYT